MSELTRDVVVIGAGPAGLAAACTVAEKGISAVVLEKDDHIGGISDGGNGLFAVESRVQREQQSSFSRADAFNYLMQYTHWSVDARLVSEYINMSASTVEWLESMGVRFIDRAVAYFKGGEYTWHMKDESSPRITDALVERAKQLGVTVHLQTAAQKLLKEGDRVTGVIARQDSGESMHFHANAVVIATGGFGGNKEWIKKYTGYELDTDVFLPANCTCITGDGLRMAWESGAADSDIMMHTYVGMPTPHCGPGGTTFELGSFRQPNLMVNVFGERFMNEETMRIPSFAGNAVHRQPGGCAFMIYDEATNKRYEEQGWDFLMSGISITKSDKIGSRINKLQEEGYKHVFMADTLEELCAKTGIDRTGLQKTVNEYNGVCASGRDNVFHKDQQYLRTVEKGPFYAARFYVAGYGTMGGIKVNHRMQVLTKESKAIAGLYAAGNDANAMWHGSYPFALSGQASAFCFNSGRIAGNHIAEYLKSLSAL